MTLQHSYAPLARRPMAKALLLSLSLATFPAVAADYLVRDAAAYATAVRALAPAIR